MPEGQVTLGEDFPFPFGSESLVGVECPGQGGKETEAEAEMCNDGFELCLQVLPETPEKMGEGEWI